MNRVLLTVSGAIPSDLDVQVAAGARPRADYVELARAFGADLLDRPMASAETGRLGRLIGRLGGPDVVMAWACYRRRRSYDAIVTDGEQVGLPLAALLSFSRRPTRHVMIAHIMSVPKKVAVYRLARLGRRIDRMVLYASAQRRFVVDELGFPPDRATLLPFMVDTRFFAPSATPTAGAGTPMICSAGLELRDYPTLVEAVRGLDVHVVLAAASPWSKRADVTESMDLPAHVEVRRLSLHELRELYDAAAFVVVPIQPTRFQAGITTILEAMAMGKAVVCSRTEGQTDTVVDGETGVYVPPGDVAALRAAIVRLLDDPDEATRLGAAARAWVVEHADVEEYARRFAGVVTRATT